jgi:hypothetical protein
MNESEEINRCKALVGSGFGGTDQNRGREKRRNGSRAEKQTSQNKRKIGMIFSLKSKYDYDRSTEVTVLPPSYNYWNTKFSSGHTNPNL